MALQLRNDQNILDDIFRRANVRVIHQFVVQPPTHFRTWSTCRSRREKQKENKEKRMKMESISWQSTKEWETNSSNVLRNDKQIRWLLICCCVVFLFVHLCGWGGNAEGARQQHQTTTTNEWVPGHGSTSIGAAINATIDKNEMNVQIISPPVTIQLSESWAPSS